MGVKPIGKCNKGDIERTSFKPEIPKFEILVERSSTKDGVTISLWKKQDDKFQVASYDEKKPRKDRWKPVLSAYRKYKDEKKAWEEYEKWCDHFVCSPYPEAKEYYKKKGISLP